MLLFKQYLIRCALIFLCITGASFAAPAVHYRQATPQDANAIVSMVQTLAAFEGKKPEAVLFTAETCFAKI